MTGADKKKDRENRIKARKELQQDIDRTIDRLHWLLSQKRYYNHRLSNAEHAVKAVIDGFTEEKEWRNHADNYLHKLGEISDLKADLKAARAENQEMREKITEAANRSGLFINFVREKLGI
jgi:glutaredoxin 2